jgi:hypothetical protein
MTHHPPPPPPLFAQGNEDEPDRRTIAERFAEFDEQHPEVYEMYKRFAFELRSRGCERGSTQQILGRIRWETNVNPGKDGGFRVNEQFKKLYAKKLVAEDESFRDFFEFRERRAG